MTRWTRARAITAAAGVALAAVLLVYSLRGIDWREAGWIIRGASPPLLGLSCALISAALLLRAIRWRILLNAQGHVRVATAFWATAAGYFGNNFLPARAGELVRTFIISSRGGLDGGFVLTTALAERVADAIALVLISAGVLLILPAVPGWLGGAARPIAAIALAGALVITIVPLVEDRTARLVTRLPLPERLREALLRAASQIARGLAAFHDARRLAAFLALTALIWCVDSAGTVIAGVALGLPISIPAAFLLIAGLSLGSALPSTPGYVGIYQFVAVTVLTPFGLSRTDAIAFILVAQVLMYLVIGFWGSLGLAKSR
jgi:glycosyltransferase 2 family protein